ncbi:reverse transcriptase domain-containing protein [Tanacetum coccineum]|uniref:Reverse transcriptase domain-containing protein n=1 Tax=Tanacetum coccineum TaxID=301880 RepID=A0ABQ5E5A8_9ASTR
MGALATSQEGKKYSEESKAKADVFLHQHIDEMLEFEYSNCDDPSILWKDLKSRSDHQREVVLPSGRDEQFKIQKIVTKLHIPAANVPTRVEIPNKQDGDNIAQESQKRLKCGRPIGLKDKNPRKRKGTEKNSGHDESVLDETQDINTSPKEEMNDINKEMSINYSQTPILWDRNEIGYIDEIFSYSIASDIMSSDDDPELKSVFGPIVTTSRDVKPVGYRWIFVQKRNEKNKVTRFKAPLVAQGFSQRPGIDYEETYSLKESEMKDLGKTKYYVGLHIKHMHNGIIIHQSKYTEKLLKRLNMDKAKPLSTPMTGRSLNVDNDPFRPCEDDEEVLGPEVPYLSAFGALMYLTNCTRSDISFAVNLLARFSSSPTKGIGTESNTFFDIFEVDLGLFYPDDSKEGLVGYADAGYLLDPHKARSQTRYAFLNGGSKTSHYFEETPSSESGKTHRKKGLEKEWLGTNGLTAADREEPKPRRGRSKSPKKKGSERKTVFKRLEKGVFHRLGDKEKSVSVYLGDSRRRSYHSSHRDTERCHQSSRSRTTEPASERRCIKRASSRRIEELSESEGSAGGHWKSKVKRPKLSIEDDLSQPWVCEETDPFTPRIHYFDFPKTRMPSHIKTYDGSEDPEDHLKIFLYGCYGTETMAMPTWHHMFNSTLTGNARVWFDDLPKETIDSYDDLKKAFLENYLQQKKCIKDPVEIHNIRQRDGESTEEFVRRYKLECRDVKGAPECMKISGFMHGITNPELIKRLHDKIPKSVDEMMRVTTAFLRGEVAASNRERKKSFLSWKQQEANQKQNFKKGGFRNQQRREDQASEILYEHCFSRLCPKIKRQLIPATTPLIGFSGEIIWPIGQIQLLVTIGDEEHSATTSMNFVVVRSPSPYNGIIGRPRVSKLQAVPSTVYEMLKIPVDGGVITLKSSRQKKRGQAADRNQAIQEEVGKLVKAGIMKEIHYHDWLSNPVIVRKHDNSWRMCVDFKDLSKACPKDGYPLPEIDWKVESLCRFPFKCFLDAYKGYPPIQMEKIVEEKIAFITNQGIFFYTKMPFSLRKARATYQRLVDKAFHKQIGRNLKVYVDDLVIKNRMEDEIVKDMEETFQTLREINMKLNPKKCTFGIEEEGFVLRDVQKLNGKLASLNRFLAKSAEKSLPFFKTLKKCTRKSDFYWTTEAEEAFKQMKKLIAELPMLVAPMEKEELIVYLAATKETVSAVLMTEWEAKKMPIYFVSRALRGPEVNYTSMEKLVLALVHASKRLKRPRVSVKGQILADFIVKRPEEESPETLMGEEEELLGPWILFTNGSSCTDGSGAALILTNPEGMEFTYALRFRVKSISIDGSVACSRREGRCMDDSHLQVPHGRNIASRSSESRSLQANYVLIEIHEGSCSMHAGTRSVMAKALRIGYYWPTMHEDARSLIRDA